MSDMQDPDFSTPLAGDLISRIQENYASLRKSERVVADYLRDNYGKRINYSITELARMMGVSEATVSRVSRALGYKGFPDMKLAAAEGAAKRGTFANIPVEIEESDSLITTSHNLANLLSSGIQGTQRMLDADRLAWCVSALKGADKVVFIGVGGAASICDEAAHMFMKAGLDVASYRDGYTQIIAAANMKPGSVLVGISHTGTTEAVARSLQLARENGAATIAITSDPNSSVARAAEMQMTTWNSSTPSVPLYGDFIEGRISQLFLIDLLYIGVLFERGDETSRHLKITATALESHYRRHTPPED